MYQDFTAKITGLEERRRLIKEAKDSEVKHRDRIVALVSDAPKCAYRTTRPLGM